MLQRIQTIWLLLASVAGFASLEFSFYSGNKLVDNVKQFINLNARENIFILILTVSIAVAALVTIFLFKDRKMQLKVTVGVLAVSLINIGLYYLQMKNFIEGNLDLTALIVFSIPVFLILAGRGIWKDEQLVKSVDRLR